MFLKSRELRLNGFRNKSYSGIRPSLSTSSPGYTLELPSTKGNVNDVLRINSVGYGASINLTSNNLGVIINATVNNSGLRL